MISNHSSWLRSDNPGKRTFTRKHRHRCNEQAVEFVHLSRWSSGTFGSHCRGSKCPDSDTWLRRSGWNSSRNRFDTPQNLGVVIQKTERIQVTAHFFMDPELISVVETAHFCRNTYAWSAEQYIFSPNLVTSNSRSISKSMQFCDFLFAWAFSRGSFGKWFSKTHSTFPSYQSDHDGIDEISNPLWTNLAQRRSRAKILWPSGQFWGATKVSDVLFCCFSQNGCRTCQS